MTLSCSPKDGYRKPGYKNDINCGFYGAFERIINGEERYDSIESFNRRFRNHVLEMGPVHVLENKNYCLACRLMAVKVLLEEYK